MTKFLSSIVFILLLTPFAFAADIKLNVIDNSDVQDIHAQPHHDGQYNLQLSPELWQKVPLKILLKNNDTVLAAIIRGNVDEPLTLYALHEGLIPAEQRRFKLPPKPIHIHLHATPYVEHGALMVSTAGRLSIYPGAYEDLQVEARRIYLNKDSEQENRELAIKRNLHLVADRTIHLRLPLNVKGSFVFSTTKLNVVGAVRGKGRGIIAAEKIEQHGPIVASRSLAVAGKNNGAFKEFNLDNKLASEGEVLVRGAKLDITDKGKTFSKIETTIQVDKINVSGEVAAPFLRIVQARSAGFKNARILAKNVSLHADNMIFSGTTLFHAKLGMWIKGKTAQGSGQFVVDNHASWQIPSPKREENKAKLRAIRDVIEGMYWNVKSINLEPKSKFKVASGATVIDGIFAKVATQIKRGSYNTFPLTVNAEKYFSLEGVVDAFSAHLSGMEGIIGGNFTTGKLNARVGSLDIPGNLKATHLTTHGENLTIPPSGCVSCDKHVFSHDVFSVAGIWNSSIVDGKSGQFVVKEEGHANAGQAKLDVGSLVIDGNMGVGSLDFSGGSMSVSPGGRLHLGSANVSCASVNLAGQFSAQQTNICGGDLSASGQVSLGLANLFGNKFSSSGQVSMDKANISYDSMSTSGQLSIGDGHINATSWNQAQDSEVSGRLHVDIDNATFAGKISGALLNGEIKHLWLTPTGYIASKITDLSGKDFDSQGAIMSPDGIRLDYQKYASFGNLSTAKILDIGRLNDRFINQLLLKTFEQQFTFGLLSINTDQFLLFTGEDFHFSRSLALSAPGLGLIGHDPNRRSTFLVNGPLMLDARETDLRVSNYQVTAQSLESHSAGNTILHNSRIDTSSNQVIKADKDVVVTPLVTHNKTVEKKSSCLGLKKNEIIHEWDDVQSSEFFAGGYIYIDGANALFDSARFSSLHGNHIKTTGNITNLERPLYDLLIIRKKVKPFSGSSSRTFQKSYSSTFIGDAHEVVLKSGDKIRIPSTIIASKNVTLTGERGVYACLPSSTIEHSKKSWRAFVCHSLSGITEDPVNTLLNFDSLVASINNVFTSSNNPVNAASALIMAGIQGYNFLNGPSLKDRLQGSLTTFHFGISRKKSKFSDTLPGFGGIFVTETATIEAPKGNIETMNGFPIMAKNVNIKCPNGEWFKEGFKRKIRMSTNRKSVTIGFNVLSMEVTDVGVAAFTSDSERTKWEKQTIACENLSVDAKNVVNMDGPETVRESREGFGVTIGPSGGSGYVISGDTNVAISYSSPKNESGAMGFFGLSVNGYNFVIPLAPSASDGSSRETQDAYSRDDDEPRVVENHGHDDQEEKKYAAKDEHQPIAHERKYAKREAVVKPAHTKNAREAITGDDETVHSAYYFRFVDDENENNHPNHNPNLSRRRGYAESVNSAIKFGKDATILAFGTADEMFNNFFGFSTDDYGGNVPSFKDSSHYRDAKKAMGERTDRLIDMGRQAALFASHFGPEWCNGSMQKFTPRDVISLYQTLRGAQRDLPLAEHLRAIIESDYLYPLQRLSDDITAGVNVSDARLNQGFLLVKNYYAFLESCEVPYGAMAFDIVNGRGLIGQLTNVNFMRQCKFAGVPNCGEAQKMVSILLAQKDASLRIHQAVSAQEIAAYHIKAYKSLDLPVYAWSGLFLATVPGAWEVAVSEKGIWDAQIHEAFALARNFLTSEVNGYSVPRMISAFTDALTCTNIPELCPDSFNITDYSFSGNPYEDLEKKWDVKKSQIEKVKPDAIPFRNTGKRFINNFKYKIVPASKK